MTDEQNKMDANFFQLVVSLQMTAMQNLGKIASPVTGKVERNLDQAKLSIDMLTMLSDKTKGNLTEEEKNLLDRALYELRMNYIDEKNKPESETKADKPAENEKVDETEKIKEEKEEEKESVEEGGKETDQRVDEK